MGLMKKAGPEVAAKKAREAADEGRAVFFFTFGSSFSDLSVDGGGAQERAALEVEAIESEGWRMDQYSAVWSTSGSNHPVVIAMFRRG